MSQFVVPLSAVIQARSQEEATEIAKKVSALLKQDAVKWMLAAQSITLDSIDVGTPHPK